MIPAYLVDGDRYPHGTRARYNSAKCRCDACTKANRDYERERQAAKAALAVELAAGDVVPRPKLWTTPSGEVKVRTYRRSCMGVNGEPCPHGAHLRKDSTGDVCARCRFRLSWNGLVPAAAAREHMAELSRKGIGRRSVSAATDIPESTLFSISNGERTSIRAQAERKILDVDESAVADYGLVPARDTVKLLREIIKLGFRRYQIARELGSTAKIPKLQIRGKRGRGGGKVLAKTAMRVAKLHAELYAEHELLAEEDKIDVKAELAHYEYDKPQWRIQRALRFFDGVTPADLFASMEVSDHDIAAYRQAWQRLRKTGKVIRVGEKPSLYALPGGAAYANQAAIERPFA